MRLVEISVAFLYLLLSIMEMEDDSNEMAFRRYQKHSTAMNIKKPKQQKSERCHMLDGKVAEMRPLLRVEHFFFLKKRLVNSSESSCDTHNQHINLKIVVIVESVIAQLKK